MLQRRLVKRDEHNGIRRITRVPVSLCPVIPVTGWRLKLEDKHPTGTKDFGCTEDRLGTQPVELAQLCERSLEFYLVVSPRRGSAVGGGVNLNRFAPTQYFWGTGTGAGTGTGIMLRWGCSVQRVWERERRAGEHWHRQGSCAWAQGLGLRRIRICARSRRFRDAPGRRSRFPSALEGEVPIRRIVHVGKGAEEVAKIFAGNSRGRATSLR